MGEVDKYSNKYNSIEFVIEAYEKHQSAMATEMGNLVILTWEIEIVYKRWL